MILKALKSVKLTVFLLILLASIAIIGTVIPQGEEAVGFAMRLSPRVFHILSALGLFDIYHTWWFRALLGLISINLIVCSVDRFPKTWKRMNASPPVDMKKIFEDIGRDQSFEVNGNFKKVLEKLDSFLERRFKNVRKKIEDKIGYFYLEEGRYSHLGVYIVHLSVIVILVGGIIGSIWGFEGYMNILEGEKKDIVRLTRKMKVIRLPFSIRCDNFIVEYYENGMPKEYLSRLTFIEDHKETKKELRVNHPVSFHGITFYQASYGICVGSYAKIRIINNEEKKRYELTLKPGDIYKIPGSDTVIQLMDIKDNLAGCGPALILLIRKRSEIRKLILFQDMEKARKRLPKQMLMASVFDPSSIKPYKFVIEDIPTRYYTGIQVSKDPGVPLVWIGFFMLIFGLIITFFTSHKRVWIKVEEIKENLVNISVSGMSNRDPVSLSKKIRTIMEEIKGELRNEAI